MVLKRTLNELEKDEPESSRRCLSSTKLCREFTHEEIKTIFEPFFRKTVQDAVEKSFLVLFPLQRDVSSIIHDEATQARRGWMLCFVNQPSPKFFTCNKIEDKDGAPLQVKIVDADNKTIVTAAPLCSLTLDVVVLDGDFVADQQMDPGEKYFNSHIVRAREGKRPLMTGEIRILLKDGVGFITDICITDNSRWTRSGKFRLGVRVLQSSSKGFGVREAVSEAFKVKDRHGETCMKHPCPSLNDKVWRLRMIRKNGAFHKRLESIKVTTVKEFLQMLDENPSYLKETLRFGNSNKIWDTIVKHATTCLDKGTHSRPSLLYRYQQVADDLEEYTFNNGINQAPVNAATNFRCANLQSEPWMNPVLPLHGLDISIAYTDQQGHELSLSPYVTSSSKCNVMDNKMEDPLLNPTTFVQPQINIFSLTPTTMIPDQESRHCWLTDETLEMATQPMDHRISDDYPSQIETPYGLSSPFSLRQFSGSFSESDF